MEGGTIIVRLCHILENVTCGYILVSKQLIVENISYKLSCVDDTLKSKKMDSVEETDWEEEGSLTGTCVTGYSSQGHPCMHIEGTTHTAKFSFFIATFVKYFQLVSQASVCRVNCPYIAH